MSVHHLTDAGDRPAGASPMQAAYRAGTTFSVRPSQARRAEGSAPGTALTGVERPRVPKPRASRHGAPQCYVRGTPAGAAGPRYIPQAALLPARPSPLEAIMQRAKAFFYVCAGIFLLALSYHLGARSAVAQAPGNAVVGF